VGSQEGEVGSYSLQLDLSRESKAAIKGMEPDSAIAKAGIQQTDEIAEVEGQHLTASTEKRPRNDFLGKAGDQFSTHCYQGADLYDCRVANSNQAPL